jgi:hypothetical protein
VALAAARKMETEAFGAHPPWCIIVRAFFLGQRIFLVPEGGGSQQGRTLPLAESPIHALAVPQQVCAANDGIYVFRLGIFSMFPVKAGVYFECASDLNAD